jgi:RHS repeat-associated protein
MAGTMTTIPVATTFTSTYAGTYDAWNRLVSLTNGMTTVATYNYDGLNRRIVKGIYTGGSLDHNEHAYYNESWQIVEVRKEVSGTQSGNPLEQYVWHPFYVDAPVLRDYDSATSGSQTRYYYVFDAVFNVTAIISTSGSVVERYTYTPFGRVTFLDSSFSASTPQQSSVANMLTYKGGQLDAESGFFFHRHRYYHPALGVFICRDPIGYRDNTMSLYEYTHSNPINRVDPYGLKCLKCERGPGTYLWGQMFDKLDDLFVDDLVVTSVMINDERSIDIRLKPLTLKFKTWTQTGLYLVQHRTGGTAAASWPFVVVMPACEGPGPGKCIMMLDENGSTIKMYDYVSGHKVLESTYTIYEFPKPVSYQRRTQEQRPGRNCTVALVGGDAPMVSTGNPFQQAEMVLTQSWLLVDSSDNGTVDIWPNHLTFSLGPLPGWQSGTFTPGAWENTDPAPISREYYPR